MNNLDVKALAPALAGIVRKMRRYVGVLLFLLFAVVYAYVIVQINSLSNPTVDTAAVTAEVKSSPVPKIDDQAIRQLQSLKDNSVNVQALFEQNRTDPFRE